MMPPETDDILREILEELRQIKMIVATPRVAVTPSPYRPPAPLPSPGRMTDQCLRCGMLLSGTMGYVCVSADCPSGFGPITMTN